MLVVPGVATGDGAGMPSADADEPTFLVAFSRFAR